MSRPTRDIAVIIAAYNAAEYLDATLASVAGQSVLPSEVIVSDDCSSDDTAATARSWSNRLPLTVVSTPANGGPAAARNVAIRASTSPLLALLDADDLWFPDHLETLMGVHQEHGGLVMADPLTWAPGDGLGPPWTQTKPVPGADQLHLLYRENFVFSGTVYTRADYDRAGGYREQFRGPEDWDLWIRMVRHGLVVTPAGHPTVLYRVTSGSLTSTPRMGEDRVKVLDLARREAHTEAERAAIDVGLRRVRAERDLFAAYRLADQGRAWAARAKGLGAVRGHRRVAVRGMAMAVAPRRVARRRAEVRSDPRVRLAE